ncbi:MAG: 3D domain-containing protein [Parcubacteria group bacterium]|nr:3D domain-containing protein [Parcubacteria group bacterium]
MILTRRQLKHLKQCLSVAVFALVFELGFPPLSLAAYENYHALARGEEKPYEYGVFGAQPSVDSEAMVLSREERIAAADAFSDATIAALPLEGAPVAVAEHWLTVTAYSSEPRQTDGTPFTTAWITPVRDGVVALNFLPKGSMVRFPDLYGDKIFIVEDRMNVRYPYRADIWMPTREEAKRFGIKYVRMEELGSRVPRDYVLLHYEAAFPGMK